MLSRSGAVAQPHDLGGDLGCPGWRPARAVLVHRFKDFTAKLFLSSLLSFCMSSVPGPSML